MSIKIKTGIITVGTAGTDFDGQTEVTFFQISTSTSGITSTTIIRSDFEGNEIGRYPINAVSQAKEVTLRKDPKDVFKTASGTIDAVAIAIF